MSLMLGTTISAKSCETAMCVFAANWRLALGIVPRSRATRNYSGQEVGFWEVGDAINQRVDIGSGEIGSSSGLILRVSA